MTLNVSMRHTIIVKRRSGLAREKSRTEAFVGKPAPTIHPRVFTRRPTPRARGFSLLEVLVALGIMAISLGVLYQTQIGATRNLTQSLALDRATLYGQSILANATGLAADHDTLEGSFEDGYRWQLNITPIDIPPPPPAEKPVIPMLQLDLDIFWPEGNKERRLHLQSLSRPAANQP